MINNASIAKRINDIVKSISLKSPRGHEFFDSIDHALKQPENEDIILELFNRINDNYGINYNLVVSGGFGDLIMHLISKGKIQCKGSILQLSGSLTSHLNNMNKITTSKSAKIEKSIGKYENKDFIFDSYYSGTTNVVINNFLNKFGSKIIKTFVVYDGNDKKSNNRVSLYHYYDWNVGSNRTVDELMNELEKYDNVPTDIFRQKILNGKIKSIIQLRKELNEFKLKSGQKGFDIVFERD